MTDRPPGRARIALAAIALGIVAVPAIAETPALAPAPGYTDRYIDGGLLAPDVSIGEAAADPGDGLARALEVDGVVSDLHSSGAGLSQGTVEKGVIAHSQWETATLGTFSLDGSGYTGDAEPGSGNGHGGMVALKERGLPFDGGWRADNALGDINSPTIGLARTQARFYLPTAPMQGLSTEWNGPARAQWIGGVGEPGLFDGIAVPGFRRLGGTTATLGGEWATAERWTVGGQLVGARDVALAAGPLVDLGRRLDSTSGLVSAAYTDRDLRVQLNLIDGSVGDAGHGSGAWVDASRVRGHVTESAGVFRIDPNLTWGNQLITNDVEGGYVRYGYQSRQWIGDVGLDAVRSVSGLGVNTVFATGDLRYQLSRDLGVGGVANLSRVGERTSWSVEGYVDSLGEHGTTRVQADLAATQTGHDANLALEQNWALNSGLHLATSVSVERITGALYDDVPQPSTVVGLAANGGGPLTARLSLEGSVRVGRAIAGHAAAGVSANVSAVWQLAPAWQLLVTYYDSRSGSWTPLTVTSPLTPPGSTVVPSIDERGAFLTLRYQRARGAHFAPLGGAPGAGSGELAGTVYLDANNNGRLDAGESGAPNVTVVLDGRYSVQTDASGRFRFPVVAAGHHVLTAVSDNVPLPWALANDGRVEVDVATRGRTEIGIGATRLR